MSMFLLRRLAGAVLMLLVVGTVIFLMLVLVPGDPAELLLSTGGSAASPEAIANLRASMGLDAPLPVQYVEFL